MLKKILGVFCALLVSISLSLSISVADAASLKADETVTKHTATIVAVKIAKNQVLRIDNLSGFTKETQAKKWISDNVPGSDWRIISAGDPEILESWASMFNKVGFKPKNPELNYKKIPVEAREMLKPGDLYSFDIRTVETGEDDGKKILSGLMLGATIWSIFN